MNLSRLLRIAMPSFLLLAVAVGVFFYGHRMSENLAAKRSFESFAAQLVVGRDMTAIKNLAVNGLMGVAEVPTPQPTYSRLQDLCPSPGQFSPANLLQVLHQEPGGTIIEHCTKFAFYDFDDKERQAIDVFYDPMSNKIVGWASYGKDPVLAGRP
jgi:hypothetical protein